VVKKFGKAYVLVNFWQAKWAVCLSNLVSTKCTLTSIVLDRFRPNLYTNYVWKISVKLNN